MEIPLEGWSMSYPEGSGVTVPSGGAIATATRVLLAEDDPLMQQVMAGVLEAIGYAVTVVGDGRQALEVLEASAINLVVTDWMMPGIDGVELCRRIRARSSGHYVYIILLTGRNDGDALIEGMEAGADDFLTKPPNLAELRVRLKAGVRVLDLERELASKNERLTATNRELEAAHAQLKRDLEASALAQRRLLPRPAELPGLRYDWLFFPSSHVGGDTFGIVRQGGTTLAFFQIDVAGHGVPAALLSFTLQRLLSGGGLQIGIRQGSDGQTWNAAAIVAELNRRFQADEDAAYFTMVFGIIDEQSGRLVLSQAGHPPPLHVRHADGTVVAVGEGGPVVGLFADAEYENIALELQPGDRLILYSDGIVECAAPGGEMFSEERFMAFAARSRLSPLTQSVRDLGEHLQAWRGSLTYEDDISLLVIEKK
jgi:sigma-B regulation protein RsbU (phosphoserine phosphatase)